MKKMQMKVSFREFQMMPLGKPFYLTVLDGVNRELQEDGYKPVTLQDCAFHFATKECPELNNNVNGEFTVIVYFDAVLRKAVQRRQGGEGHSKNS